MGYSPDSPGSCISSEEVANGSLQEFHQGSKALKTQRKQVLPFSFWEWIERILDFLTDSSIPSHNQLIEMWRSGYNQLWSMKIILNSMSLPQICTYINELILHFLCVEKSMVLCQTNMSGIFWVRYLMQRFVKRQP